MSHFDKKANDWDKGDIQVNGAKKIADAIHAKIALNDTMKIIDFGVGTGLLGFEIAKITKKVYGIDTSEKMLEKVTEKNSPDLHITTFCQDIMKEPIALKVNGIVSSMTLHHVENLKDFFNTIYKNLKKNSFIAIADLETEDGTFHSDNSGVFHFGFDKVELCNIVEECGFLDIDFKHINTIIKNDKEFNVFLLTAKRKID